MPQLHQLIGSKLTFSLVKEPASCILINTVSSDDANDNYLDNLLCDTLMVYFKACQYHLGYIWQCQHDDNNIIMVTMDVCVSTAVGYHGRV